MSIITTRQISQLESEAGQVGDHEQVALCQLAMSGEVSETVTALMSDAARARVSLFTQDAARAECERVIQSAGALDE